LPRPTLFYLHSFFSCSAPPRDLPSFPTRRSSDLGSDPEIDQPVHDEVADPHPKARHRQRLLGDVLVPDAGVKFGRDELNDAEYRSEEHTSELQSLTNLVCRLLLEKTKTSHHSTSP